MAGTVSVLAKSLCAISGSPEIANKGSSFFLRGALRATFRLYEWKTMVTIEINAQHTLLHKPVSGISAPTSSSLDSWMHCCALFLPLVFKSLTFMHRLLTKAVLAFLESDLLCSYQNRTSKDTPQVSPQTSGVPTVNL